MGPGEENMANPQAKARAHVLAAQAAGYSVHTFTASGGAVALLALYAAIERDFATCFAWLGAALFIDGVDGTMARAARVKETAKAIDGVILDLVVDFLTYVLVPVVALWRSDLMPIQVSFWIGLVVTMASALYFADTRMKTSDNWFRGFPALWNVLIFFLFVMRPPWWFSAFLCVAAVGAMFAPIVFVHPMRVTRFRAATMIVTVAWFALASLAISHDLRPELWVQGGFLLSALYFLALPFLRHSPWATE